MVETITFPVPHGNTSFHVWVHTCVMHACVGVCTGEGWTETPHLEDSCCITALSQSRAFCTSFIVLRDTMTLGSKARHTWNPALSQLKLKSQSISALKQRELKGLYPLPLSYVVQYTAKLGDQNNRDRSSGLAHNFHACLFFSHTSVMSMTTRKWGRICGKLDTELM